MTPDDSKRQDDSEREWWAEWARGAEIREQQFRKTWPVPERLPRLHTRITPAWDDEQFSGQTFDPPTWTGTATANPKRIPITSSLSDPLPFLTKNLRTTTSLRLCQICRRAQAEWPREISWQRIVWGLRLSLVLRSPFACTNCRIMRFKEQQALGHRDYRPFWNNVISFMTGQSMTATAFWIRRINRWRGRHGVA